MALESKPLFHLLADDFRVEERFRFERHLFSGRLGRDGEKPSVFLLGTQQGRAASRSGSDREPSRFAAATRARRRQKVQHPSPFRPAANRDGSRSGTSNIERRTSNIQSRKAGQSHPKPPHSHMVGIYAGVQSPPKATPKPPPSHTKATPKPHQGYTKATPKPPQSQGKAKAGCSRWWCMGCFQGRRAERSKSETRRPKAERNPKSEGRIHSHPSGVAVHRLKPFSDFGFRPSFGSRVSAFGFKGCQPCAPLNRPDTSAA